MISDTMLAALVGLGLDAGGDGESFWPQAWRRGDGFAGAVGFRPVVRRRGVAGGACPAPFDFGAADGCCEAGDGDRALFGKGIEDKDDEPLTAGADVDP